MKTPRDRCIALAGLMQVVELVDAIAKTGNWNGQAAEASIKSIFRQNTDTTEEVYGGFGGIEGGLRNLHSILTGQEPIKKQQFRYALLLLQLDKRLVKHPVMYEEIAEGINLATEKLDHFPAMHQNMLANLAETYRATVSTLTPRIMVQGDSTHLSNPANTNRIRALLLAGIRSSRLLHQCGGGVFQIAWQRKAYLEECTKILTLANE